MQTVYETEVASMRQRLRADESFDIIERHLRLFGGQAAVYYVNGLINGVVLEKLLAFMMSAPALTPTDETVPYGEVKHIRSTDAAACEILSGMVGILFESADGWLILDLREYPQRTTSEPENDRVIRGAKDGFVETVIFNMALIRRRIRSENLIAKAYSVGRQTKTDVIVAYMDGKADAATVERLCSAIEGLDIERLTMNQQSLIEALYKRMGHTRRRRWFSPLPKVKYTERPDVAAAVCMKGNIVILVDNSPSAVLIPTSIFDLLEEADDWYFSPMVGTYLRLARYLISFVSVMLTPLWLLLLQNPGLVPERLRFVTQIEHEALPIFWQLMIIEIGIDGLRLAAQHTPGSLTSALGIIGAIAFSQFGIDAGWFEMQAVLYEAFVTVANNSTPNYELGYALKFMRIGLCIAVELLGAIGGAIGLALIFAMLVMNHTLSGKSYLYPLVPLNLKALGQKFTRTMG